MFDAHDPALLELFSLLPHLEQTTLHHDEAKAGVGGGEHVNSYDVISQKTRQSLPQERTASDHQHHMLKPSAEFLQYNHMSGGFSPDLNNNNYHQRDVIDTSLFDREPYARVDIEEQTQMLPPQAKIIDEINAAAASPEQDYIDFSLADVPGRSTAARSAEPARQQNNHAFHFDPQEIMASIERGHEQVPEVKLPVLENSFTPHSFDINNFQLRPLNHQFPPQNARAPHAGLVLNGGMQQAPQRAHVNQPSVQKQRSHQQHHHRLYAQHQPHHQQQHQPRHQPQHQPQHQQVLRHSGRQVAQANGGTRGHQSIHAPVRAPAARRHVFHPHVVQRSVQQNMAQLYPDNSFGAYNQRPSHNAPLQRHHQQQLHLSRTAGQPFNHPDLNPTLPHHSSAPVNDAGNGRQERLMSSLISLLQEQKRHHKPPYDSHSHRQPIEKSVAPPVIAYDIAQAQYAPVSRAPVYHVQPVVHHQQGHRPITAQHHPAPHVVTPIIPLPARSVITPVPVIRRPIAPHYIHRPPPLLLPRPLPRYKQLRFGRRPLRPRRLQPRRIRRRLVGRAASGPSAEERFVKYLRRRRGRKRKREDLERMDSDSEFEVS